MAAPHNGHFVQLTRSNLPVCCHFECFSVQDSQLSCDLGRAYNVLMNLLFLIQNTAIVSRGCSLLFPSAVSSISVCVNYVVHVCHVVVTEDIRMM